MKIKNILFSLIFTLNSAALAIDTAVNDETANNFLDSEEYDPSGPNVEATLKMYDKLYEEGTGESPFVQQESFFSFLRLKPCSQNTCQIWARIDRAQQKLFLYQNGQLVNGAGWDTSTGAKGHGTPAMDTTISNRIYNKYSSGKYPGGDYNGLGNMPYAVFIKYGSGGFAIHGTPQGNWKYLGTPASHGCVRIHPDNAAYFNQLVRGIVAIYGTEQVWVTIE